MDTARSGWTSRSGFARLTRRRLVRGLAAAGSAPVLSAAFAACGQAGNPADAVPPTSSALSGTVQHVYWGGAVEGALQYAMDGFVKRFPVAKVELVPIANAMVQEKLILLVAAGTPPDAAQINPRQLTPLIDKGILMDVTRYAKRDAKEFQQEVCGAKSLSWSM